MVKEKEISLKIEILADSKDSGLFIHSKTEIRHILKTVCERNTRSAMYYDAGKNFVLTMLLAVTEEGIWIDAAPRTQDNQRILNSDEIIFVSSHNSTKVQFSATGVRQLRFEKSAAFFLPLPERLLRLQRRDYFRLDASAPHPLKCIIKPMQHEVAVMDISLGGLSLALQERGIELAAGEIYKNCVIDLPEIGTLNTSIQVKNIFEITTRSGKPHQRAGCEFIKPDSSTTMPLQRYVAQMQRRAAALSANV